VPRISRELKMAEYVMSLSSLDDSQILAEKILSYGKRIICMSGDLGVGKTTLAGMIIRKLLSDENLNVKSPTFNIVQMYEHKDPIHHYDLYRLKNLEEALDIGIEESFDNAISIIEWPEIIFPILPKDSALFIDIELKNGVRNAIINLVA
jgi:tRNA threonylcarbamoyl adenosine modification protein YjeE